MVPITNPHDLLNNSSSQAPFRRCLLNWYAKHARSLPWRGTTDPYRIWVSEIMLQQTTTQTVKGYFDRFVARFPNVQTLAAAELDEVNHLWEGLGYYRRCAQMHRAAKEIVERFGGVFPDQEEDVASLPGIGRYTTGAILSIAFDRRLPILEANTLRLHARLLALKADPTQGEANKMLWSFAKTILPLTKAGRFNQALMDLGSIVCTPHTPTCSDCPVVSFCETARLGLQDKIPYPKATQEKESTTEVALLVRRDDRILLVRYPADARWGGLWDFPRAETAKDTPERIQNDEDLVQRLFEQTGYRLSIGPLLETVKHSVTRFRITLYFHEGAVHDCQSVHTGNGVLETRWADPEEIRSLPMHSSARKMFKKCSQGRW